MIDKKMENRYNRKGRIRERREKTMENLSFGECVKGFLKSRELSVLEGSKLLGMKSATSLFRILHDEVNIKTLEKIYPQIIEAFSLTAQEKNRLQRGLMISRMGVEQYLGYKSMWRLLFPQKNAAPNQKTLLHITGGMSMPIPDSMQQFVVFLMNCAHVEITLVGCCTPEIISAFYPLTIQKKNIKIIHFMPGQKKSLQQMIGSIAAITPFLPYSWYSAYLPKAGAPAEIAALYEHNEILIDSTDDAGNRRLHHVVQVEKAGMQLIEYEDETPFQFHRQLLMRHIPRLNPIKTVFSQATHPEEYVTYTEQYRQIEENRAIYSIKPDLPINFIHPDLMVAAVMEGFTDQDFGSRGALEELVGRLYQIHLQRWKNIFEKKKVTHIVFSAKEMLEFARSGILTDHFFAIRAFTPAERKGILQNIRKQMAENPYFNVYFSRDDHLPFQFEMTAYEQWGVQLNHAHTSYNFAEGHAEALILQKEFWQIFISFYQFELLQEHVLSARESLALMDQLIAAIPERK